VGVVCTALAAAPQFEVSNALGTTNQGLFEVDGLGLPSLGGGLQVFSDPFVCDGTIGCDPTQTVPPGGLHCCVRQVQTATATSSLQQSLTLDESGNAWWINAGDHHIHYYLKDANQDVDLDNVVPVHYDWASVAAGAPVASSANPTPYAQVWATTTSGDIFAFAGYIGWWSGQPTWASWLNPWQQISGPQASAVQFMNETDPGSSCSSDWHIPWVVNTDGQIYQYFESPGQDCFASVFNGSFWPLRASGLALAANDIVIGGTPDNPVLYQWRSGALHETPQPPFLSGVHLRNAGAQVGLTNQVWITDTQNNIWWEMCPDSGC
jgi:hypothetical protein